MSLTVLNLDRAAAGHLAVAIRVHRGTLDRVGIACPRSLIDLQHLATEIGAENEEGDEGRIGREGGEMPVGDGATTYGGADDCQLTTQKEAAMTLGVHPRTVRSWLDRGDLQGVTVGGRRRVPRSELDRLTNQGGTDAR